MAGPNKQKICCKTLPTLAAQSLGNRTFEPVPAGRHFSKIFGPPGPYGCPGKINKIVHIVAPYNNIISYNFLRGSGIGTRMSPLLRLLSVPRTTFQNVYLGERSWWPLQNEKRTDPSPRPGQSRPTMFSDEFVRSVKVQNEKSPNCSFVRPRVCYENCSEVCLCYEDFSCFVLAKIRKTTETSLEFPPPFFTAESSGKSEKSQKFSWERARQEFACLSSWFGGVQVEGAVLIFDFKRCGPSDNLQKSAMRCTIAAKKKLYTTLLQWGTFLRRKKWGPQRNDFGGWCGFLGSHKIFVPTAGLESVLLSPKSFPNDFLHRW